MSVVLAELFSERLSQPQAKWLFYLRSESVLCSRDVRTERHFTDGAGYLRFRRVYAGSDSVQLSSVAQPQSEGKIVA